MILVDTGPLGAAANRKDTHHRASTEALAASPPPRLVPGMVIAEVGYLLARDAGSSVEAGFLRSFKTGFLDVVSPLLLTISPVPPSWSSTTPTCRLAQPTPASSLWPSGSTSPSW